MAPLVVASRILVVHIVGDQGPQSIIERGFHYRSCGESLVCFPSLNFTAKANNVTLCLGTLC